MLKIKLFNAAVFRQSIFLVLFGAASIQPADAEPFKTSRATLLDPCGQSLVVRGVNAGIAFPSDPTAKSLSEVTKTGANTVRLTFRWMFNKSDPHAVKTALQKAADNHMLAIPSIWDATGSWERLPFAVDFWTQPEMVAVLRQYEDMILLNIANEAGAGDVTQADFRQGYLQAIRKIRKAGLHMPLVIDAAGYGRDESYILQNAQYLIANDPDHKLLFSWHPWDVGQPQSRYKTAIDSAVNNRIPLLIGEISSVGATQNEAGDVDFRYLMQYAAEKNVGWLWWWWSSGSVPDQHALTVDGTYGNWANVGEEVVSTSPFGISATSKRTNYLNTRTCAGRPVVTAAPRAPANLKAVATQGVEIGLSWTDRSSNEKNFDIEIWDEPSKSWRLVKVVGPNTVKTTIGAGGEFIYSLNSQRDTGLNYDTTYQIRVGAYSTSDAISYSAPVTVTTNPNPGICSNGDGLLGEYFDPNDTGAWQGLVRTDAQINFNWGAGSPDPTDPTALKDHFVVAWQGEIEPQFDGEYTFYTDSDDFARVLIDGNLVIDNWRAFAKGWAIGKVQLTAGVKHAIQVEYMEWDGNAKMSLYWASNQLKRELVPQCRLFSPPAAID